MLLLFLVLLPVLAGALQLDSLLLDLAQLSANNRTLQQTQCVQELAELWTAWHTSNAWALKALDASGGGLHNFMLGDSLWLGNWHTCRGLNEPLLLGYTQRQQQLLRQAAPFEHAYSVAYLSSNSSWRLAPTVKPTPLLHIGLCAPSSCDPGQLEQLLRQALHAAAEGDWERRFELQPEIVGVKRPELRDGFLALPGARWLLLLLAVSLLLLLLGSTGWRGHRVLACFDVAANWRRLWQLPAAAGQEIAVINGLRVCSAFALIALHVIFYQHFSVNHSAELAGKLVSICMRKGYLPAAMEVFFVVSGFLTASNFLRDESLQRNIASDPLADVARRFVRQAVQRYLRLAPLHCIIVLLAVVSFSYHREASVFHLVEPVDELCIRHWWRNVLFVQNLFPVQEMCCNWTWSLGCDLQMHIVALLLLYTYTRYPRLVQRIVWLLFVGNMVYVISLIVWLDVSINLEELYRVGDWLYTNPLVRMISYLIGAVYGYAHARGRDPPFETVFPTRLSKCALAGVALWLAEQLLQLDLASPTVIGLAMIMVRTLLSAGVAHLILCSFRLEGSFWWTRCLVRFLELSWFQRLNRISYSIYLLNPLVILNFYYSLSDGIPADALILLIFSVALSVIISLFSIPLTLFFELPFNRLASLLLPSTGHKSKTT